MVKGKLITIYGINNIGKSTQAKLLVKMLKAQGKKAVWVKFPVKEIEPSGSYLDQILRANGDQQITEAELQLWFVINRFQFQPKLISLLKEGYIVVAEDYIGTGIAWGMAKGLKENWLVNANEGLIKPDFSILLEGNRFIFAKEAQHIHEQNDVLIEKSRSTHEYLAKKYGWKRIRIKDNKVDTSKIVIKAVDDFLQGR